MRCQWKSVEVIIRIMLILQSGQDQSKNSLNRLDQKPAPQDEYVSSEKSTAKPMGLYRNGYFDDPKKADHRIREKCTTNTDKVDREIQKLKEVKQQLEQQIRSAFGNEKEIRELEKKLAQIESELSQKDHDTYRRQNAEIS